MNEPVYRIKPLEWKYCRSSKYEFWEAECGGAVPITAFTDAAGQWIFNGQVFASPEAAKAAAEKWYRERLMTALVPVEQPK